MTKKIKAWELATKYLKEAVPRLQNEEESRWTEHYDRLREIQIIEHRRRWKTEVPGSLAPDHIVIGAIQAMGNKGIDVSKAEELIPLAEEAYEKEDHINFLKYKAMIYNELAKAPKIEGHKYFTYKYYDEFEDYLEDVDFPEPVEVDFSEEELFERIHAGWQGQIAGAAIGTITEGYTTDQLRKKFGEIRYYLRTPSTHNDDVLFELAFLDAIHAAGKDFTSDDIALEWISKIDYAWSAEEAAHKNIQRGIFPPESAKVNNFWNEWIGAQMRGSVCGLVAPGNPKLAAELAWKDGRISHINNGIIGEVFNAILVALAFVEDDVREVLDKAINLLPKESEYYSVIEFAYNACKSSKDWEEAWRLCEKEYEHYNWIHTYPNAAAEVVALYFGGNDFDECMHVISMCGQDVDCNAGQIGTIYGVMQGYKGIDEKWMEPFNDEFVSLYRGFENTTISYIADYTIKAYKILND